jgi:hypothetical protein
LCNWKTCGYYSILWLGLFEIILMKVRSFRL